MRLLLLLSLVFVTACAEQAVSTSSTPNQIDIRILIGGIAFISSIVGAFISHYFTSKRDRNMFYERIKHEDEKLEEQRNFDKKGVISVLLAESKYLKKQANTRSSSILKFRTKKDSPSILLTGTSFTKSIVYIEYLGQIAHLGEKIAGQVIRFQSSVSGFNESIEIIQSHEEVVKASSIDTLESHLKSIHTRADLVIALFEKELGVDGAKEKLTKLVSSIGK